MESRIVKSWDDRIFDFINTAILAIIMLMVLYPLIFIVSSSFSTSDQVFMGKVIFLPKNFTVMSYIKVFQDSSILTGYRNTILYTSVGTFINLVMNISAAYPLSRRTFKGRNAIMFFISFTMLFSGGLIPSYLLIRNLKLYDTFWVMVLPNALSVVNIIIMRTYFQSTVPDELFDSAFIDGCSNFRALFNIVLPLSKAVIAVIGMYYAVGHWNAYFSALIYIRSESRYPLQLILRSILIQNSLSSEMVLSAESFIEQASYAETIKYSVIVVSSLPVLLIYPFIQKYFVKGVMIGAIKG